MHYIQAHIGHISMRMARQKSSQDLQTSQTYYKQWSGEHAGLGNIPVRYFDKGLTVHEKRSNSCGHI